MPWVGGHPEAILAKLLWLQAMMLLSAKEVAHVPPEESEFLLASLPPSAWSSYNRPQIPKIRTPFPSR